MGKTRLSNTRMVSLAAGYLQELHIMLSQEAMGTVETNTCRDEERYA